MTGTDDGPRTARIESLDVLRGLAVLGILAVNVGAFAMSPFGYANPTLEADFGPQGQAVWTAVTVLFQMKFITLFTALFGAGIVLMAGGDGYDADRSQRHARRMAGLLVIGLVHAYAFWYGDILVPYAVAGFLLTGARGWSVRRLAITGAVLAVGGIALMAAATSTAALLPAEEYAELVAEIWAPPPDVVIEKQELFRAPWPERLGPLAKIVAEQQLEQLIYYMPRLLGVMMLGMALLKAGFFTGGWRASRLWLASALAPAGAVVAWLAARGQIAGGFELTGLAAAQALVGLASLPQAFGYAALVMLLCRAPALAPLRAPFAAAGQMALSCYLGCTVAAWLTFYGPPGLGLIGTMTRLEQLQFVLWAWLAMLVIAPLWLSVFAFGPIEWAWRSLTYGALQPIRARKRPGGGLP